MAQCPQCYTGTCARHKAQDSGRSAAQPANAQGTLNKMYEMLVGAKLQKLQAEAARDPERAHSAAFRQELDESREKSLRKQARKRSKLVDAGVSGSGLNPQALAATYGSDASESDGERGKRKEKKKKKSRKKHSSSRRDKDGKSRKRRRRSDSDSDESSSSSDDDSDSDDESSDGGRRRRSRKRSSHRSHRKSSSSKRKSKRRRADSE